MSPGVTSIEVAWGPSGLRDLAPRCDVVVIVDVLRFTTAVDVAVARGAVVYPYRWHDGTEQAYADEIGAELAVKNAEGDHAHRWSLSPVRLRDIPARTKLVLPSPNGAALAFGAREAGAPSVLAGCVRNAPAVGRWLADRGGRIGVLASGERWNGATGPLRPAVEDWLGAGAIVSAADPARVASSPDAIAAAGSFAALLPTLQAALNDCMSGQQLRASGLAADVDAAAEHGVSTCVPRLDDACFVDGSASSTGMGRAL